MNTRHTRLLLLLYRTGYVSMCTSLLQWQNIITHCSVQLRRVKSSVLDAAVSVAMQVLPMWAIYSIVVQYQWVALSLSNCRLATYDLTRK